MALYNTIQTEYITNAAKSVDMIQFGATGCTTKHSLVVDHASSGAVAGVLNIFRGTKFIDPTGAELIAYDTTAAATITVTGTDLAAESASFEIAGCEYWRGVLSGLSASSVAYWCIAYADRP
jgi:hypothetical protein